MMEQMPLETTTISPVNKSANSNKITLTRVQDGLAEITNSRTSLVIWQRQLQSSIIDWLLCQAPETLPHGRVLAKHNQIKHAVTSMFEARQKSDGEAPHLLKHDIIQLAKGFATIAKCDQVDIRLEVIQHDACQKFHLDNVALRLVTTYIGKSTQYVMPEFNEQALREQKAYTGPVKSIPDQSVAIFKGARTPGDGIVHRSPPIAGTGQTRLFLCINTPSDVSPTPWQPDP